MAEQKRIDMGENVAVSVAGNKLTLEVDLTKDFGTSKSGKTKTVGNTHGFINLSGFGRPDIIVSVNVNKKG